MHPPRTIVVSAVLSAVVYASAPAQQPAAATASEEAAFLFAYHPKDDTRELFAEGYRRHLAWHREHGDPLPWYAWHVVTGDRIGLFVDGTFGISFEAFDRRVEPQADGADFAQTTAAFADPVFRRVYRLRSDLSTSTTLESRNPTHLLHVIEFSLRPGTAERFEAGLRAARQEQPTEASAPAYTWYELVTGGGQPGFMLMIPASSWSELASATLALGELVSGAGPGNASESNPGGDWVVERATSETWMWAPTLTYLPEDSSE